MYLDPGFGGMLVQVIVALIAAGGAILFSFRKKIKKVFSKNKNQEAPLPPNGADDINMDIIDTIGDDIGNPKE